MARRTDDEIDALFQLPLDEFTAARNALAKGAGAAGTAIRELSKPPVAAWAVNQLYWRERNTYDALIEAADALRRAHKGVLAGRAADLRAAGRVHDQALDAALKATLGLLTSSGHPASDATRQAIVSTLRALPADEAPGRLTRVLQPGGFEALAGFPIAKAKLPAAAAAPKPQPATRGKQKEPAKTRKEAEREAKALARAREAAAAANEALRRAENEARRQEFERARAAREADKAAVAVERAREAIEQAQQEFEEAQAAANTAAENRARAEERALEAEEKVKAAQAKLESARAALPEP